MTRPAPMMQPDAPAPQISICEADFHVTAPHGPLSSPELLLQALRREILPVLSEVLESAPLIDLNLRIPRLEIDLGHWPDDPRWADLRADFAYKLRQALALYPGAGGDVATPEARTTPSAASAGLQPSGQTPPDHAAPHNELSAQPGQAVGARSLTRRLRQMAGERSGDVFELIARLYRQMPELPDAPQGGLACMPDRAWLARLAAARSSDRKIAGDLRTHLARAFRLTGLTEAEAVERAGWLTAAMLLRFGSELLETAADAERRPAPAESVAPATHAAERSMQGQPAGRSSLRGRAFRRRRTDAERHPTTVPTRPGDDGEATNAVLRAALTLIDADAIGSDSALPPNPDAARLRHLKRMLRHELPPGANEAARSSFGSAPDRANRFGGDADQATEHELPGHMPQGEAARDGFIRELTPKIGTIFRQAGLHLTPAAIRIVLLTLSQHRGSWVWPRNRSAVRGADIARTGRDGDEIVTQAPEPGEAVHGNAASMDGGATRQRASGAGTPGGSVARAEMPESYADSTRDLPRYGDHVPIPYPVLRAVLLTVGLLQERGCLIREPGDRDADTGAALAGTGHDADGTRASTATLGTASPGTSGAEPRSEPETAGKPAAPAVRMSAGADEDASQPQGRNDRNLLARASIRAVASAVALLQERGFLPPPPDHDATRGKAAFQGTRSKAPSASAHDQMHADARQGAGPEPDPLATGNNPIAPSSPEQGGHEAMLAKSGDDKPQPSADERASGPRSLADPQAPATHADLRSRRRQPGTPDATDIDGDLAKILESGAAGPPELRRHWASRPDAVEALLLKLPVDEMLAIAMRLMPPGATILRDSIRRVATEARLPGPAMLCVLRDLFGGRAIDLKAAMAAEAVPPPDGPPDVSRPAPEPDDVERSAEDAAVVSTAAFFAARGQPRKAAIATVLHIAGVPASDILRVLAPDSAGEGPTGVEGGPDAEYAATPDTGAVRGATDRADLASAGSARTGFAPVSSDGAARIDALLEAGLDPDGQDLRDSLMLILQAWPSGGSQTVGDTGADPAGLRRQRNRQLLLERLLDEDHAAAARDRLAADLAQALARIEPDEAERARALRYVVARIGYGADAGQPGLRVKLRRILTDLLTGDRAATDIRDSRAGVPPVTPAQVELLVTEYAGIVLLHAFLKPLFSRLNLLTEEGRLERAGLPRGLAALRALDGRVGLRGADPLLRLLLGLPDGAPEPETVTLDDAGRDLVDSLLRAVISHWGRLGKTSPDGLRETFLQRPGTLRFDEDRVRLRVMPGPFDMLLDGLPWGLGLVALPWMASPCHVSWRDRDE